MTRSEVVVGEVGTAAFEFLADVSLAIHVAHVELVLKVLLSVRRPPPSEHSLFGSRLCHLAWNTYNMYYIRIYHDIAKIKDYNGTIDSPSMALSPLR
jgi:hypothetical protein